MKKIALLSMMALLGACGTRPTPVAPGSTQTGAQSSVQQPATAAAPRQAEAPADPRELTQTGLVERADGQRTTLDHSLPGGQLSAQSLPDKSVPIILVHGFSGYGRDELKGTY